MFQETLLLIARLIKPIPTAAGLHDLNARSDADLCEPDTLSRRRGECRPISALADRPTRRSEIVTRPSRSQPYLFARRQRGSHWLSRHTQADRDSKAVAPIQWEGHGMLTLLAACLSSFLFRRLPRRAQRSTVRGKTLNSSASAAIGSPAATRSATSRPRHRRLLRSSGDSFDLSPRNCSPAPATTIDEIRLAAQRFSSCGQPVATSR
jgi:hypothetical protein